MPEEKAGFLAYYLGRLASLFSYVFSDFSPKMPHMDYDKYWVMRGRFEFSTRYEVFASLIDEGSEVLDIGCGEGATLAYLAERKKIKGEGLDISERGVRMCAARGIRAKVADASAAGFSLDAAYDYIIVSEVLEHIPNPEALLEKLRGKFRKGLIISVPNTGYYLYRLRLLFGRFPVQWALHPGEHLRFWTLQDFRAWLRACGYAAVGLRTHTGFLFLHRAWPSLFADSLVFLVREAGPAPAGK